MRERIIELLGHGIAPAQVADAVGCDPSYISNLMSDENISAHVKQLRAEHYSKYMSQDQALDSAEEAALTKVSQLLQFVTRPAEAARVYSILNAAKRRTATTVGANETPAQTVTLDLPEAARVRLTVTHDRQVIEVAGRSMTTMPARSLAARLEQRHTDRMLAIEIPSTLQDVPSLVNKL